MTTVAVIGGGIAGMGAARVLLAAGIEVVVLEAARRLGGHCLGVRVVDSRGREHTIDAGVSDFNRTTFTEVSQLVDGLGLPSRPSCGDTDHVSSVGRSLAHCRDGVWHCGAVRDSEAWAEEVDEFRARVAEVLDNERFADWSVEDYLDHFGMSRACRELYVYPRAIGCLTLPDRAPRDLPIVELATVWHAHGLAGVTPGRRHCVVGGMHHLATALQGWLGERGARILFGTRVAGIVRRPRGVAVRTIDDRGQRRDLAVDHVVMTGHACDVAPLLEDATAEETAILSRFSYRRARLVVHQDERLMGHDRSAWGARNYLVPGRDGAWGPTLTLFPNRLARLPASVPDVFVSVNPHRQPRPHRVLVDRAVAYPIADPLTRGAIRAIERLQGQRRTWYAGGHLIRPFVLESALRSGMYAAARLVRAERGTVWGASA